MKLMRSSAHCLNHSCRASLWRSQQWCEEMGQAFDSAILMFIGLVAIRMLHLTIRGRLTTREFGAGDEARTRNFQLGKLNFHSFIFTTYKIAQEKCTCMHCIPCMRCLICVSLRDVCGTVLLLDTSSESIYVSEFLFCRSKAVPSL